MILSLRHRFIFVRGRKVAGTSVEMALSTFCGGKDIATPMIAVDELERQRMGGHCGNYSDNPLFEAAYINMVRHTPREQLARLQTPPQKYTVHMSVAEVVEKYPASTKGFRIVAVQRNPYARVISALNMLQSFDAYRNSEAMHGAVNRMEDLLDRALQRHSFAGLRNTEIYRPADASQQLHIIRYENLQADFERTLHALGIDTPIVLPHAKKGLMSDRLDPKAIFRRDQLDKINAIFAAEFELFKYPRV